MMEKISLEEYRARTGLLDTEAQFELAWEYFRGRGVPKDLHMAIALLRQLEQKLPELARYNIAKMKCLVDDPSFAEDIRADCDAGYGPALYLVGVSSKKKGTQIGASEAIRYFQAGSQSGHLPSKMLLWRVSKLGFWRRLASAPAYLLLVFRSIKLASRNRNDVRVLI